MPPVTHPTYPGVYLEEVPSQAHTVTGATTSSTAFVDFFSRGPIDRAVQVNNFSDFTRTFGGLDPRSEASYGLMQFFTNGGQVAWVGRVGDGTWEPARASIAVHEPQLQNLQNEANAAAQSAQKAAANAAQAQAQKSSAANPEAAIATEVANDTQTAAQQAQSAASYASAAGQILASQISEWDAKYGPVAAATQIAAAGASDASQIAAAKAKSASAAASAAAAANATMQDGSGAKNYTKDIGKASSDVGKAAAPAASFATALDALVAATEALDPTASGSAAEYVSQSKIEAQTASNQAAQAQMAVAAATAAVAAAVPPSDASSSFNQKAQAAGAVGQVNNAVSSALTALGGAQLLSSTLDAAQFLASNDPNGKAAAKDIAKAASDVTKAVGEAGKLVDAILGAQSAMFTALADVDPDAVVNVAANAALEAAGAAQTAAAKATAALQAAQEDEQNAGGSTMSIRGINPGAWGNNLRVAVQNLSNNRFNLFVTEVKTVRGRTTVVTTERYQNLTLQSHTDPSYGPALVNHRSRLVQIEFEGPAVGGAYPIGMPSPPRILEEYIPLAGGNDGNAASPQQFAAGVSTLLDTAAPSIFNILCLPAIARFSPGGYNYAFSQTLAYAAQKRAFLIADIPENVRTVSEMTTWVQSYGNAEAYNSAVYFPRLTIPDPLQNYRPRNVGASGTVAGIYARSDQSYGIWRSPAGTNAVLEGANLVVNLGDQDTGALNQIGVNVLRTFAVYGNVVWGARTLAGSDLNDSPWKYINVRRLADYIEDTLIQSLKWVVFENNDDRLWGHIRAEVGSFMGGLYADGAFAGKTADKAYILACDGTTTTQTDIANGIVNILVGFAPLYPAEFVFIKLEQLTAS